MAGKKIENNTAGSPLEAHVASSKIRAEHIDKVYKTGKKSVAAIEDVSIDIQDNDFVCIVGPSGCGKSTLLRMLAGLDFPSAGNIIVNDRKVTGPGPDRGMAVSYTHLDVYKRQVTNRPGARLGPRAIRNMSQLACCFSYPWDYKISEKANIIDYGDVGYYVGPKTTEVMLEETHDHAKKILDAGCKLLTLGGDHTIPYGMVRAASEKYGRLALLHFDSHQDSTPSSDGNVSHANFAYDLQAEGCIDPNHSAQVFIRTEMTECGYHIFYAQEAVFMDLSLIHI